MKKYLLAGLLAFCNGTYAVDWASALGAASQGMMNGMKENEKRQQQNHQNQLQAESLRIERERLALQRQQYELQQKQQYQIEQQQVQLEQERAKRDWQNELDLFVKQNPIYGKDKKYQHRFDEVLFEMQDSGELQGLSYREIIRKVQVAVELELGTSRL